MIFPEIEVLAKWLNEGIGLWFGIGLALVIRTCVLNNYLFWNVFELSNLIDDFKFIQIYKIEIYKRIPFAREGIH